MLPVPSTVSKVSTLADQTVRVTIDFQELPASEMAELFALRGGLGYFVFSLQPKQIEEKDIPDIPLEKWEKNPSQRLRAVLYRAWEQSNTTQEFEVWYRTKMENLIESVKEKLN